MLYCSNSQQRLKPGKAYLVREEYFSDHCFDRVKANPKANEKPVIADIRYALEDVVADAIKERDEKSKLK